MTILINRREVPWLWSFVPPPQRFYMASGPAVGMSLLDVSQACRVAWEQELRSEMREPEWPSQYWERIEELRSE